MKAYVAKNQNGSVTRGWLLKSGTKLGSAMCRLPLIAEQERVEEVPVELAVRCAARDGLASGDEAGAPLALSAS
jgi:hypothetical protein